MELAGRAAVFEAGLKQALATRAADLLEALDLIPRSTSASPSPAAGSARSWTSS